MQINKNNNLESEYNLPFGKFLLKQLKLAARITIVALVFVACLAIASMFTEASVFDSNVSGYWRFNENTGTTTKNEIDNQNAILSGAVWNTTGKINSSIEFTNDEVMAYAFSSSIARPLTINFWAKGVMNPSFPTLFSSNSSSNDGLFYINAANRICFFTGNEMCITEVMSSTTYKMYSVVVLANGTTYIYVNNVSQAKVSGTGITTPNISAMRFGQGFTAGFTGALDEIAIFNKALNQSEISELYNSGAGLAYPYPTPVTYSPVFVSQSPSDISSTNVFGTRLNVTYNYTDPNITNTSSIILNYSSTLNDFINGTSYSTLSTKTYNSNALTLYSFLLGDNLVYPGVYNINESIMEATTHNSSTLNNNNILKIEFLEFNTSKTYNLYEIMANTTGASEIFYCNSTYSTGNPSANSNCYQFATLSTSTFNHSHGSNSSHNIFNLPVNSTGFIGSVKATSTSYFLIKGTNIGSTNYYYISNVTRTGQVKLSTDSGASYTNQTFLVDSHIHQFLATDSFNYNACYTNNSGTQLCSTSRSDAYNLTPLPPTSPIITSPTNTKYEVNSSINITWLASIPFNSSTTITSYNVSLLNSDLTFNRTINGSTTALSQNNFNTVNMTGSYYIRVEAKDSNGLSSYDYSEEFNITSSINLSLKNAWSNVYSNNFTGWAYETISGSNTSFASGTDNSTKILLDPGQYLFYIEHPDFSISSANYYYLNLTSTLQKYQKTFNLYTNNSIVISIYDEADNSIILQNISIRLEQNNLTLANYYTTNGTYFISNLADGAYSLVIGGVVGVNYTSRSYDVTVASRSTQNLNAFLINSGLTVTISALDSLTFSVIEGATVSQYRSINNTWTLVQVKSTDITGRALFYYLPNTKYRFTVQNTDYQTKQFDLDPVIYDTYGVYMQKNVVYNYVGDYEDVHVTFTPWQYFANKQNNFIFIITSPDGTLQNYGYNITSKCYNTSGTGNNSYGERLTKNFNLTCANFTDLIVITYYYDTVYTARKTFSASFYVSGATTGSNYTFANMRDQHYGMGDLERILIVTFFVLIIAGVTYAVMGGTSALIIGLLIYGYFTYTGFISFWFTILTTIIGVLIWYGGRE